MGSVTGNLPAEHERLAALRRYAILDTPHEPEFDTLVARATRETEYSTALLCLMDADRCWFKAADGLKSPDIGLRELPRQETFCNHAFRSSGTFVVTDARADPRFSGLAVVARPDGYRAYVGAQIITPDGHSLGTVCLLDDQPRTPTEAERAMLHRLADEAMTLLDRRLRRLSTPAPTAERPLAIVADDDTYVRIVAAEMLKHLGYSVLEAGDGLAALQLFRERQAQVRLVLTDFNMPGCDGLEVTRALLAESPAVHVVMMSGRFETQVRNAALAGGVAHLLSKPFVLDDLRAAVPPVPARRDP